MSGVIVGMVKDFRHWWRGVGGQWQGVIVCMACLVYTNSLTNQLVFDDRELITHNLLVRDPWNVGEIFSSSYWGKIRHADIYRPLTVWTLACNYRFNEALDLAGTHAFGFHIVNIGLHAAVCVVLYYFLLRLGVSRWAGLTTALLFAIHPIHVEAVAGITGRAECLAGLWGLIFLSLHRRRYRYMMANLVYLLALWSKESGITFMGLALWMDVCFRDPVKPWPWKAYGSYLLTTGGWLALRDYALRGVFATPSFLDNPLVSASLGERLLTAAGIQFEYLKLQVVPVGLSSDYSYAQIEIAGNLTDWKFLGFVAVVLVAGGLAWRLRQKHPVVSFAVLGYAILFSATSNFLFPIGTIMGERLVYSPSILFSLLLGYGFWQLSRRYSVWPKIGVVALFLLWAGLTLARNRTWASPEVFHQAQILSAPRSARAHSGVGKTHFDAGVLDSAVVYYQKALDIYPHFAHVWYNLGLARYQLGDIEGAVAAYERAAVESRGLSEVWYNLGFARDELGDLDGAIDAYEKATSLQPEDMAAWYNLGMIFYRKGDLKEALQVFQRVNDLQPGLADGWYQTGRVYEGLKNSDAAVLAYEKVLSLQPDASIAKRRLENLKRSP